MINLDIAILQSYYYQLYMYVHCSLGTFHCTYIVTPEVHVTPFLRFIVNN